MSGAAQLGIPLSCAQAGQLLRLLDELDDWNQRMNLTAIRERSQQITKHLLDSLSLHSYLRGANVVDIGTGAGFPGLPLKIVRPELTLTLVEATGKKVTFLEAMVAQLGLGGVTVVKARAEEIGQDPAHRERYDWVLARAVAEMPVLLEYTLPLARVGGHVLAQKGESAPAEAQLAAPAARRLGGQLRDTLPIQLPGLPEPRYLVIYAKTAATPRQYPRRPGVPSKTPLR